jgi:hypothetical protein
MKKKNITEVPVRVECYSGYKSDEYPVRFFLNDMRIEIGEIIDQWHQAESKRGFPAADYFKVRSADDKQFILKHEHDHDRWYLWIKGESLNIFT